jgi:protoheme IX farnesyltransferase
MKPEALAYDKSADAAVMPSKVKDILTLAKPRVNTLVVATTAAGYYMAGPTELDLVTLALVCAGTALVASGAAAINQVHEHDTDQLMLRTRLRPVADGRMSRLEGALIAALMTVAGLAILGLASNSAAVIVAFATFASYAGIYTPLKRRTSLSTVIGAVPGALPPLIGWAAVRGSVSGVQPWTLFLIMFFWQLPHFLAIAWMFREDYARAGLPMLTVVDKHGAFTGRQATLWAAALIPFSQLPYLFGMATSAYAVGAVVLGLGQLWLAFAFARHRSIANAKTLFLASIVYLPLLWVLMMMCRRLA